MQAMTVYEYVTTRGRVMIAPIGLGRFRLLFNDEALGDYASPRQAADEASGGYTFTPSCGTDLGELGIPDDPTEWTAVRMSIPAG